MSLSDLASLGSFVSGFAVLVSLIYLALQVRQTKRAAWRIARPNFGGPFLAFMDGVVARSAAEPPVDLSLEAWKLAFASEASRISGNGFA